ncbi:MAG: rRNA maturation RNase YbeY [Lachnospiraceae bacterium]|nr:rRNA maturation RNase YbeY [Lachnospiraceae bacterium]
MTAAIENETGKGFDFDHEALFNTITETVLSEENCPYDVTVSLFIVDNKAIRTLNRESRGIDSETDVLSFPMLNFEKPAFFEPLEEDGDNFDPDSGELLLGDIVLSYDKIFEQAESYGHSIKREYAFLIVHSLLHLLGYDHIKEEERKLMEDRQEKLMAVLNIPR